MRTEKIQKKLLLVFADKIKGFKLKLPKNNDEKIAVLQTKRLEALLLSDSELFCRYTSYLIVLMWLWDSETDYLELEIECYRDLLKLYQEDASIEDYLHPLAGIEECLNMFLQQSFEVPTIPLDEIEAKIDLFENNCNHQKLLSWYDIILNFEVMQGDFSHLHEFSEKILTLEKDEAADCLACIYNRLIEYYLITQDFHKAKEIVGLIERKKLKCESIPEKTKFQQKYIQSFDNKNETMKKYHYQSDWLWELIWVSLTAMNTGKRAYAQELYHQNEATILKSNHYIIIYYYVAMRDQGLSFSTEFREHCEMLSHKYDSRNRNKYYSKLTG